MPGHFTHIYTARRVADLLASGKFTDWPSVPGVASHIGIKHTPEQCGKIMQRWEKFTAVGAVGPDLFYFSQDYNSDTIGPRSDMIMLALAAYYFFDAAKEDDWEPLLIILQEVNEEMAGILRILIKLQKAWKDFLEGWNATVGPVVDAISAIADDLLGGLLSQFQVVLEELKNALIEIGKQEALTFADIFSMFDSCVQKGWPEKSFLWSDMSHYRRTTSMAQALIAEAESLKNGDPNDDRDDRHDQFLAFALGYITHIGTDTVAHSWVNEQTGGMFRNHPQRHHVIENHVDAWNYKNGGFNPHEIAAPCPKDPWAATADYPDISMSALWFHVQMTPDDPHGQQRPSPLPTDPVKKKKALDVDGEMPLWMAESIVRAMIATFTDHPHPLIYGGGDFQASIDEGMLTQVVDIATGEGLPKPFQELLDDIAPPLPPGLTVPRGFPLPWQIQTMYRIMITFYKFSYNGTWELEKPKRPDFIIWPPASDFENLLQPPDFSGVSSGDPLVDVCEAFIALVEYAVKQIGNAIKLAGDLIKMATSPGTYPIRLGLWELAMLVWDVVMKTHDLMAHTGFTQPHAEQLYPNGELRLPNEIDLPLITLGASADGAFRQALADAIDPLGNLDTDGSLLVDHPIPDARYPLYPVLRYSIDAAGKLGTPPEGWEYHRPWAYPDKSRLGLPVGNDALLNTPTEKYDPNKSHPAPRQGPFAPVSAGPYPAGIRPDHVFFRTDAPVNHAARTAYEHSQTPAETDRISEAVMLNDRRHFSPIGDPVPFSAYLIGRIANSTGYHAQFNLDSDRGFAYLTWDWIRSATTEHEKKGMHTYNPPVVQPAGDDRWLPKSSTLGAIGALPMELTYVDPPPPQG